MTLYEECQLVNFDCKRKTVEKKSTIAKSNHKMPTKIKQKKKSSLSTNWLKQHRQQQQVTDQKISGLENIRIINQTNIVQ